MFFGIFAGLVILGAATRVVARNRTSDKLLMRVYKSVASMLLTMGGLGMVLYFFTYEEVYIFGARFWYVLWFLGFVAWGAWIFRYAKVTVPALRKAREERASGNEYLPRKKRR